MKHFLKICLLVLAMQTLNVACHDTSNNKVNEEDLQLIYQLCPDAKITEVEYKENGYIEVEYTCNEQKFEAGILNNMLVFNETAMNESDIPLDKINKKLKKEYEDWIIDEVSLITANDTSFIKVEIVKGGLEQNLYFTQDGKWYNAKSIITSNKWDVHSLAQNMIVKNAAYNFLMPDTVYDMPPLLREISGIEILSPTNILCVQDELGAVFEYDIKQRIVSNSQRFTDIGDFEDIAIKGDSVYVLRSDGKIFNFNYKNNTKIHHHIINVNSIDIESLFYNPSDDYFYIISKDVMLNVKESKRIVFRYKNDATDDLENYLEIDIKHIKHYIDKHFPMIKSHDVVFNPSAIAIHPITHEIYILSASDRLLTVYDNKTLKAVYPLPAELYYKPEGIAFFENGDMLISNEGDKTGFFKGNISLLKYK